MTKLIASILLVLLLCLPASAAEFSAPEVPDSGSGLMPSETQNFGSGMAELLKKAFLLIRPDLPEALRLAAGLIASVILVSALRSFSGISKSAVTLTGAVIVSIQLLSSANSMLRLGCDTINELSNYGKLLLPVMAAALAAQGGVTASASLYVGTTAFDTVLSSLIARLFTPMVLVFIAIGIAVYALGDETLKKLQELVK